MSTWRCFTVEITSASVSNLLTTINKFGLHLFNIRYLDELRILADTKGPDCFKLFKLIESQGGSFKIIGYHGAYFIIGKILKRPVLLIGCLVWLFLVMYLPTHVLFIYVDGNRTVDSARIIEAAEKSGISFGASRRYVRSEKVKNKLLSEIDTLQWAGVNTFGCVAVISVKERAETQNNENNPMFNSIIAARDGIITQATVTRGTKLCKIGQSVRQGQILVSGFTDCGLSVKTEQAEAEIMAFTNHNISAVTPLNGTKRVSTNKTDVEFSIQIGKNIVKLSNNSGIHNNECVKIYTQKHLTLPGGFKLPISFIAERICISEEQQISTANTDDVAWMEDAVESYLLGNMVAGKILCSSTELNANGDVYRLNGSYDCNEMIGKMHIEKVGKNNG